MAKFSYNNIEELIEVSICVEGMYKLLFKVHNPEEVHDGLYAEKNGNTAFVYNGNIYMTSSTDEVLRLLKSHGFEEGGFYVTM